MKACFYIGPGCTAWSLDFFPDKSPGELSIAGKSWCRHMVDQCSRLNISDIYIADCYYYDSLSKRMGNGDYWSLKLHYLPSIPCALPEQLLEQHPGTIPDSELLIVWGQVLPDLSDIRQLFSELREVESMPELLPDGIWLIRDGKFYECVCPLLRMRTLREYFDLNFHLLKKTGIYNLPGYSNNEGCVFGMDVLILPECELEKPLLIQDNVRLERKVSLRNDVIIGKDVLIDEDTLLEHSLVLDHTYIGKHMFFRNKIIDRNRVIDVPSETCVELDDAFLTGSSQNTGLDRFVLTEFILALFICVGGLPLYLLAFPFRRQLEKLAFFFFAFQVYPKCWLVLRGRAHLVRYGHRDPDYAFRYSDQWLLHTEEHQKLTDDIYFYYNRSILMILGTVVISLLKRLFILEALPSDARTHVSAGEEKTNE